MRVSSRRVVLRTFVHALLICGVAPGAAFAQISPTGRLESPSPFARQAFGNAVSVSGDTLVVGAPGTAAGTPLREGVGAAHVYERDPSSGAWALQATLLGTDDMDEPPRFGASVAIDGDTMVVGAPIADGSAYRDTGAAHVYERDAAGNWVRRATFTPTLTQPTTYSMLFGVRVAISGSTIAVGARADNPVAGTTASGAVYTYVRNPTTGTWSLEQVIRLPIQESTELFGEGVAIDGDTLVVGAPRCRATGSLSVRGARTTTTRPAIARARPTCTSAMPRPARGPIKRS